MSGVCTPLTSVCYVNYNSWKERRKGSENLEWFYMFHLRLPFTFYCTHKIIYMNVCMLNAAHRDSVYTPNGSFVWITSAERTSSSLVQSLPPPPPPPRCQQYERITNQVRFPSNNTCHIQYVNKFHALWNQCP